MMSIKTNINKMKTKNTAIMALLLTALVVSSTATSYTFAQTSHNGNNVGVQKGHNSNSATTGNDKEVNDGKNGGNKN